MKALLGTTKSLAVTAGSLILLGSGCAPSGGSAGGCGNDLNMASSRFDVNAMPLNKVVCDPFGGEASSPPPLSSPVNGVKAQLYYRTSGMPIYTSAQNYIDLAHPAGHDLFFPDINVPTRMFDKGFASQTSDVVKDDNGQTLIEYFGLKMSTVVHLRPEDPEGNYEFSLLSDDGAVMKIRNPDESWSTYINNDGDHPTRMGCATSTVKMTHATKLEIEVDYYQGPRYHIANTLMWRPVTAPAVAGQDKECGQLGNTYFFDPNNNSLPQAPYNGLIARGWKVLDPQNFLIPGSDLNFAVNYNPCVQGVDPVISDFHINELTLADVWVQWTTDIPATDQAVVTDTATGISVVTMSDNVLRTVHHMQLSGLKPHSTYTVKAISISDTLGKAISNEITFGTP
jgi:hypothetical protein